MLLFKLVQILAFQIYFSLSQGIRFQVNYTAITSVQNNWGNKVQTLVNYSTYYMKQIIQVQQPNIPPLSLSSCLGYNFDSKTYTNVDYVIFVSIVSDPTKQYVAYSDICDDGTYQPTVGAIIFNAAVMNQYFDPTHGYDHQRLLDVTIRELIHLLGMHQNLFSRFVTPFSLKTELVYTYLGAIPVIKTPIAVQKAQIQFNCSSITQVPVVLVQLGSGVNLFPTFMQPDIASDYIGTEGVQRILSPITLGILDDSGWYIINYSFANSPNWGLNKGCEFVTKSCNSSLLFPEFCYTPPGSSQCTYSSYSVGKCVYMPQDANCLLKYPDQKSPQYPAQKLTCRNAANSYPWTSTTEEIYSSTSGCFNSNLYQLPGDKGLRCYNFSCSQTQLLVSINGSNIQCSNSEIQQVNGVTGQLQCPTSDQILYLCNGLAQTAAANYCSMQGLLQGTTCQCDQGFTGPSCDQAVTCDETCQVCQTTSALSCKLCNAGLNLQDPNNQGIGWCQLNSVFNCAANCSTCQTTNQSKCITCNSPYVLAEVNMRQIGYCIAAIANCARVQYNSQASTCFQCATGFRPFGVSCMQVIAQCLTYTNQFCSSCQMGYHLSNDTTICVKNVLNCLTYTSDKLNCYTCVAQFLLFNQQCFPTIAQCLNQNQTQCVLCNPGYHFTPPNCMPNISQCQNYSSVVNGVESCVTCLTGFITNSTKCVKQINNCLYYSTTSNNQGSSCSTCVKSYHIGNSQFNCYIDVPNCYTYNSNGNQCAVCQINFDLTFYFNCNPTIANCSNRNFMDDTLCATCVNAAYSLSPDQKSCIQPIPNCLSANVVNKIIICQYCLIGFHISNSQTTCYPNLNLCQVYNDTLCLTCNSGAMMQNGVCYTILQGCQTQSGNTCLTCNPNLVLVNNTICIPPTTIISNCLTYLDLSHCSVCNTSYSLNIQNTSCYSPIANCSTNVYNQTLNSTICMLCLPTFFLRSDQLQCQQSVTNCQTYTTNTNICIQCNYTYLLDTQNNLCQAPIPNCQYRNLTSPSQCLQCQSGYQLANNGTTCYNCPIKWCLTCAQPSLVGLICSNCQPAFQPNLQRNQCLPFCQVSYQLNYCISCPYNQTSATVSCSLCADGYYLSTAYCYACTSLFANCQLCNSQTCTTCLPGYYYDYVNKYCYSCGSKYGDCQQCNSTTCQQCNSGSVIQYNSCLKCADLVPSCSTCAVQSDSTTQCQTCLDGYFFAPQSIISCISCSVKFSNCAVCSMNTCLQCTFAFYLDQSSNCNQCDASCASCSGSQKTNCLTCQSMQVLLNGQCTANIAQFLLNSSTTAQTQVYALIDLQQISNMTYTQLGALDYKQFFCDSDSNCNMNGRCIVSQCRCISNLFGSRCQFTNTSIPTLQQFQYSMLGYLTSLKDPVGFTDLQSRLQILQSIGESTQIMNDENAQTSISQMQLLNNKFANLSLTPQQINNCSSILLNSLGSFGRNFQLQQMVATGRVKQLDDLTSLVLNTIVNSQIQLPYQRIVAISTDLKDPKQLLNFTSTFQTSSSRLLQSSPSSYVCNNDIRITKPQISLNSEVIQILQAAQVSASVPVQTELIHYYYNPHVNTQGQTIDSTVFRAQFSVGGTPIVIQNLQTNIQLLIPKIDQSFSDTNAQIKCLTWNNDKQIWDTEGIDNTLTVNCRFYVVCFSNHLSDFGMQVIVPPTVAQNSTLSSILTKSFDLSSIGINSGFYLSVLWVLVFIFFWILFWCQFKRAESHKRYKEKKLSKSKSKYVTQKSLQGSKSPRDVSQSPRIERSKSRGDSSPRSPNTSRAVPQVNSDAFQIPIDQYLGQGIPSNLATDRDRERNFIKQDSSVKTNSQSQMTTRMRTVENMWFIYPIYSIWKGKTSLVIKIQKLSLIILQLQVLTTATAGFLSIKPFKFGYLTIYFLIPIILSWFSNYLFGMMAVCFRKRNGRINCFYWFFFIVFDLGLIFLSIYLMFDLDVYSDFYLLFGVSCQFVIDLILVDLFVAYFYQSVFEDNNSPVAGIFRCVRFRGYFIEERKK